MKRFITLMILLGASAFATAQDKPKEPTPPPAAGEKVTPKAPYDSTKGQLMAEKQKNLQLQAAQLQVQYQSGLKDLGDKYNVLTKSMNEWVASIRKDNGWDDTYTWNSETDTWTHAPKPAAPSPAAPEKK